MSNLQSVFEAVRQDENLLKGYASRKCSSCYGRGYVELKEKGEPPQNYMCDCVSKRIKKEFSDKL